MAELSDDVEAKSYVERRHDPSDGPATPVLADRTRTPSNAHRRKAIERIEGDYAQRIGRERFEAMCRALEDLLDDLDPRWSATTTCCPRSS